ncbi:hypothetical protein BG003_010388, partial [Podila horticola]
MDRKYSREFLTVEDKFVGDSCQSASDIQPENKSPMEEVRATIPSTSLVPLFFINLRYILLFAISLALSFVTCLVYAYMPWSALFLAIVLAVVFVLPVGIVQAVTNQQPSLNIVTEFAIGYLLLGHAIANVTFKTYGYIVSRLHRLERHRARAR